MNHNRIEASERARFLAIIWASATRRGNSPKSGGFKSHGVPGAAVKEEMTVLEARRLELLAQLEAAPASLPRLHPNLAELYRQKVTNLAEALNDEHTRLEAAECIRELIDEIRPCRTMDSAGSSSMASLLPLLGLQTATPLQGNGGAHAIL